jgi:hypothetical protein
MVSDKFRALVVAAASVTIGMWAGVSAAVCVTHDVSTFGWSLSGTVIVWFTLLAFGAK